MKNIKFSVLMSVYYKENALFLKKSIESIYDKQTLKPNEIVLVEDGKLTPELYEMINILKNKLGDILKIIPLEKNMGLGNALNIGIQNCSYEYIARMDTDDIAYPNRFYEQISFLQKNQDIDIVGSYMNEFVDNIENVICVKTAPTENIKKYIRFRSPMNHPSVIYKKSKVLEAGNYLEISFNEDIYLWARMLAKGHKFANIPKILMCFRVTNDTYQRRGGIRYIKSEFKIQKELLKLKLISIPIFLFNIITKSIVRLMPNNLRKFVYLKLLRKNTN